MKIPNLMSCCCCIPIKTGLLIIGYLRLVTALLVLWILGSVPFNIPAVAAYIISTVILYLLFDIILIVATHKDNLKLFKVAYCYSFVVWIFYIAGFLTFVTDGNNNFIRICYVLPFALFLDLRVEIWIIVILYMLFQTYIVLLISSKLNQLKQSFDCQQENYVKPEVTEV